MKKMIFIGIALMLVFSGISWAEYKTGTLSWTSPLPGGSFTTSNDVSIEYTAGAQDSTGKYQSYIVTSYHSRGDRTFGTSSGDTKIYYKNKTAEQNTTPPNSNSATANWSGWSSL